MNFPFYRNFSSWFYLQTNPKQVTELNRFSACLGAESVIADVACILRELRVSGSQTIFALNEKENEFEWSSSSLLTNYNNKGNISVLCVTNRFGKSERLPTPNVVRSVSITSDPGGERCRHVCDSQTRCAHRTGGNVYRKCALSE